ncbi:MAG: hypothetical protein K6F66_02325 [Pseudobutyrivibrio sp.]|nr:hypothetical protein [Pseudobutyrivibrio sp.]
MNLSFNVTCDGTYGQVKEAIIDKLKSKDKETSIYIGGKAYTNSEWERFLMNFDKAEESLQETTEDHTEDSIERKEKSEAELAYSIMISNVSTSPIQ